VQAHAVHTVAAVRAILTSMTFVALIHSFTVFLLFYFIFSTRRYESNTPLLRDLHWLRVPQRVEYKLAVLVYRCLHDLAPAYLSNVIRCVADISSRRRLRSSSTSALVVPAMCRSTVGDRAFHVATSRIWNRLPPRTTSAPSLQTFKKRLKSFLFGRSFSS